MARRSAAGWNAGDLERFMAVYADDAVFVTPKGLVQRQGGDRGPISPQLRQAAATRAGR